MRNIYTRNWRTAILLGVCICLSSFYLTRNVSNDQITIASHEYDIAVETKPRDADFEDINNQACIHPTISKWKDFNESSINKNEKANCGMEEDWVYTGNGKFYISSSAVKKYGEINCIYTPIDNVNDNFKRLKPVDPMLNNTNLLTDAFEVMCTSTSGKKYSNIHACISQTPSSKTSSETSTNTDRFNVIILGLDSLSRAMFQRVLPNTHAYFTEVLGGTVLEGYNVVGDGTTFAIMPLLTGTREIEIPEVRRGYPGAKPVDSYLDFIWKKYERKSYVTQWAEDWPKLGTFHYRLRGFKDKPVAHYMRPFYLALSAYTQNGCIGQRSDYQVYLNWLKEGIETNKGKNFFTVGFVSEYTHGGYKQISSVDEYNTEFLKYLQEDNKLDNTFVIFMSDHGMRFGKFRMTEQGKLEERLPYFGLFVPPKFRTKFPEKYQTFLENKKRLTVPSDIHETLLDIIDEKSDLGKFNRSIYSLFSPIPRERTCTNAGIEPHWCACQKAETISVSDQKLVQSVQKVVSYFNSLMKDLSLCHLLSVKQILRAVSLQSDDMVLKFKSSWNRIAVFSDEVSVKKLIQYQVTFETDPGSGVFEVTYVMNPETEVIDIDERSVSRLNRYNDAPKCIEKSHPGLRMFCYCRT